MGCRARSTITISSKGWSTAPTPSSTSPAWSIAPDRAAFEAANATGTANVIAAMKAQGPCTASSMFPASPPVSRNCPTMAGPRPRPNAMSRGAGSTGRWWRPPAIYGPHDAEFLELFQMATKGLHAAAAGRPRVSIIHADDLAALLIKLAAEPLPETRDQIYEVDDGPHHRLDAPVAGPRHRPRGRAQERASYQHAGAAGQARRRNRPHDPQGQGAVDARPRPLISAIPTGPRAAQCMCPMRSGSHGSRPRPAWPRPLRPIARRAICAERRFARFRLIRLP